MRAIIRTHVTFTDAEVIEVLRAKLKRDGVDMTGELAITHERDGLTITNMDRFPEQVKVVEEIAAAGTQMYDAMTGRRIR